MTVRSEVAQHHGARLYAQLKSDERPRDRSEDLGRVVEEHAPLVRKIARRMARNAGGAVDLDDLTSVGVIGLIDAYRRYDPAGGRAFPVYAEYRIRGAMLDELRRLDPMTQPMRRRARKIEQTRRAMCTELGRDPTDEELASRLDVSLEKMQSELNDLQPKNFVPVTEVEDLEQELTRINVDRVSARTSLARAIATLPERSQQLLSLYYEHDLTLKEIGSVLEVTEARVCQLHKVALKSLREHMVDEEGP